MYINIFVYCFPDSSVGKESACNAGNPSWIPGSGRSAGEGIGYHSGVLGLPLWLSWYRTCLQSRRPGFDPWVGMIPWRRERLPTPVLWPGEFHGLVKSRTQVNNFHFQWRKRLIQRKKTLEFFHKSKSHIFQAKWI